MYNLFILLLINDLIIIKLHTFIIFYKIYVYEYIYEKIKVINILIYRSHQKFQMVRNRKNIRAIN